MGSLSTNSNIANSTVIQFNPQAGATYTLQAGDSNKVVTLSNAGGCTVKGNPALLGPGFHCWIEARNNAANLITQFGAEKFFMNGVALAGVTSFNLSPAALQTGIGWDDVVHIATDGTDWHVIQGGPNAAASLTLAALATTGTYTPAQVAGIVGTNAVNDAQAGSVGETIISSVINVNVSTVVVNLTSIALTAGDWDCSAYFSTGAIPATCTAIQFGISQTSATMGTTGLDFVWQACDVVNGVGGGCFGPRRVNVNAGTTLYCVIRTVQSTVVNAMSGTLIARRRR